MINNLKTTSDNLHIALEQYLHACRGLATSLQGPTQPLSGEDTQQINTELASMLSYEEMVREARLIVTQARNCSSSFTPINSLPSEVLARIFEMIVEAQPCILTAVYDDVSINREHAYPDLLMQVCSRWRQIVESHSSLWVHIDFVPTHVDTKLISRAETYAKRAGKVPLEVHIVGTEDAKYDYRTLVRFLESFAGKMKALELFVTEEDIGKFYSLVLEKLLLTSDPAIFTQFSIRSQREHRDIIIHPSASSLHNRHRGHAGLPVNIPLEALEGSFASIKALESCSIFLPWNSKAYHGLVELKLTSSMDELYSQIDEGDLVAILKASPGLRTLHFVMDIVRRHKGTKLNGSVVLNDLEELEVHSSYEFQDGPILRVGRLLRLLTPGSRPLSLMLKTLDYSLSASWETIKRFLARSNVIKFHANTGAPLIDKLLRRMPHLAELTFSRLAGDGPEVGITIDALKQAIDNTATVKHPLKSLTMRDSIIYLNQLQLIVELCPTKSLVFRNCVFWKNKEAIKPMNDTQLSSRFPSIKFIKEERY